MNNLSPPVLKSLVSFFMSSGLFMGVALALQKVSGALVMELELAKGPLLNLLVPLYLDVYGAVFCGVVTLVSFCVVLYSSYYMGEAFKFGWYCFLIKSFVAAMVLLVTVPSVMGVMVGWDGLGLISFLLVIFYEDKNSLGSGLLTFFSNRVGDGLLLSALFMCASYGGFNTWDLLSVGPWVTVSLFLVVAATTKSAQFPFSAWLPAAMAAPTPVSALVHSSTLVTGGCFLLFRFAGCLGKEVYLLLSVMSSVTCLYAGSWGVFEWDMKKVVALSTMGQMGMVMVGISLGAMSSSFFHLVSHALYKSLLFLCVGVAIHSSGGSQDLRHMGNNMLKKPLLLSYSLISVLSLVGLPFLSAFYSKDLILESLVESGFNCLVLTGVLASLPISMAYSLRLLYSFVKSGETSPLSEGAPAPWEVVLPCSTLGLGSVVGSNLLQWWLCDLNNALFIPMKFRYLMLGFMIAGLPFFLSKAKVAGPDFYKKKAGPELVYSYVLEKGWFLPKVVGPAVSNASALLANVADKQVEEGWVEWGVGPEKVWLGVSNLFKVLELTRTELMGAYVMKALFFLTLLWVFNSAD